MTPEELYKTLGYLTNPERICKLDAEMLEIKREGFVTRYQELTGVIPTPDNQNFFILHSDADKWSVELRIYFVRGDNIPEQLAIKVVKPRSVSPYNSRINNNKLIWELIEHGFRLGNEQDENEIRKRVPVEYIDIFNEGYALD